MSRRMTQLSALLAQGLAACALCMAAPCQAETLEFPGSPLKRSFDGIFSSLIPDAPSSNTVIVREGAIPGRVYGGSAKGEGTVSGNTVIVQSGSATRGVFGGFNSPSENPALPKEKLEDAEGLGTAQANTVILLSGTISGAVGGWANGFAQRNGIVVSGGTLTGLLAGGLSYAPVTGNMVTINAGTVKTNACGGVSRTGMAFQNRVSIGGEAVVLEATGGEGSGGAVRNAVFLWGGAVEGGVAGGHSDSGTAVGNEVAFHAGTVGGHVAGGIAEDLLASRNIVVLGSPVKADPPDCHGFVTGGQSGEGPAEHNAVIMHRGFVAGNLRGGAGASFASGNKAAVRGGAVAGEVAGGVSLHQASDNSVAIDGGDVADAVGGRIADDVEAPGDVARMLGVDKAASIAQDKAAPEEKAARAREEARERKLREAHPEPGATSSAKAAPRQPKPKKKDKSRAPGSPGAQETEHKGPARACGNTVAVTGGRVLGSVTGGISEKGVATGNTVELGSKASFGEACVLQGGVGKEAFEGNALEVEGQVKAGSARAFERWRFDRPPATEACLQLAGKAVLGEKGRTTQIAILDVDPATPLPERFVLVRAEGGIDLAGGSLQASQEGIVHGAELFDCDFAVEGNELVARVRNVRKAAGAK